MYFWKIDQLEKDLEKGLEEKENLKYLLIMMIFMVMAMTPMIATPNYYDYILAVITVLATIFEILFLYKINKGENGQNFLSRYFSIGFVVFIRSIVFLLLPLMILLILGIAIFFPEYTGESTGVVDILFTITYLIGYIFMQAQSFKRIHS